MKIKSTLLFTVTILFAAISSYAAAHTNVHSTLVITDNIPVTQNVNAIYELGTGEIGACQIQRKSVDSNFPISKPYGQTVTVLSHEDLAMLGGDYSCTRETFKTGNVQVVIEYTLHKENGHMVAFPSYQIAKLSSQASTD